MIIVHDTFVCKPGNASKMAKLFREWAGVMPKKNMYVMTDMTGQFHRVIVASNHKNLAEYEKSYDKMPDSPKAKALMKKFDNMNEMEFHFRNLGMPGVIDTGQARKLIGLREEAIKESQNLRNQEQGWQQLSEQEQNEIADRVKWGADYQNYWGNIFDAAKIDGVGFMSSPVDPGEKKAKQNLTAMVGNELELALSRDPQTRSKAKDNALIDNLAEKIATDKNFISLVNQQAQGPRNIRLIRMDIERLLKEWESK